MNLRILDSLAELEIEIGTPMRAVQGVAEVRMKDDAWGRNQADIARRSLR